MLLVAHRDWLHQRLQMQMWVKEVVKLSLSSRLAELEAAVAALKVGEPGIEPEPGEPASEPEEEHEGPEGKDDLEDDN
jgi:hypothetical protein